MNKKTNKGNMDGVVPLKKSIRNVSLPKRGAKNASDASAPISESISTPAPASTSMPAPRDTSFPVEGTPLARAPRRTKHLSIDVTPAVQEDIDYEMPVPEPIKAAPNRGPWSGDVEKAFLSSEDISLEKKAGKTRPESDRRDEDDFGNTSAESHFQPLRAEQKRRHKKRGRAFAFVLVVLLVAFGLMHTIFAHVSITLPVGETAIALSDEVLPAGVSSSVITKNSETKVSIDAVKTVTVSKKASGTVILYNNYSTDPYELIATTRLSTANGSIYKLLEGVKIPGKKGSTPGTISAKAEADQPGSEYNAKGGLDLKLPGLIPGTKKYINIYAKTAANFTGGSKGTAPDLASSGLDAAIKSAKEAASADALAEAKSQNPGLVFLGDSASVVSSYDSTKIPAAPAKGGPVEVPVKFTAKVIGLSRDDLKKEIEAYLATKQGYPVSISAESIYSLQIKVSETDEDSLASGKYSVRVSGTVSGSFGPELQAALKRDLAGKSMLEAALIIHKVFPDQGVTVKAWPFWKNTVPADPEKIKILIKNA